MTTQLTDWNMSKGGSLVLKLELNVFLKRLRWSREPHRRGC